MKSLQAIIVADCFNSKFGPLNNPEEDCPLCLFDVANVPTLHYIIEFLISNNVNEIIIPSKSNKDRIEELSMKYKYKAKINVVGTQLDSNTLGGQLREIAEMKLIQDDFIVVRGDIITNIDLSAAFKMHYYVKM